MKTKQNLLALIVIDNLLCESFKLKRKRTVWMKKWLLRRQALSCYNSIIRELKMEDRHCYRTYLRMNPENFEELLGLVGLEIKKKITNMRQPIPAEERLALTLRFLCTGLSFSQLAFDFRVARQTISLIVMETCQVIYKKLAPLYMKVPYLEEEWKAISNSFQNMWDFPNCLGALDGKHVLIEAPQHSGSVYYNYKGTFSIVLMALVDANCKFVFVDVGRNGRVSDGGIYARSVLKSALDKNLLGIPASSTLPGTSTMSPYTIVADSAFPLKPFLMKPYPLQGLTSESRVFNMRLSRARRTVENAFGILAKRWEIFRSPIRLSPVKSSMVVLATCVLHNYLRTKCPKTYTDEDPGETAQGLLPLGRLGTNNFSQDSCQVRDNLRTYFTGIGSLEWILRPLVLNT